MLATPVRLCGVTRTPLPKAMLQSFGLVRHPETNQVWWIPEGVDSQRKPASEVSGGAEEADDPSSAATQEGTGDEATTVADGNSAGTSEKQTRYRYPAHVLARLDLMEGFAKMGNRYYNGQKRLATNPHIPPLAKTANWRPDMDGVILDQRRRHILDDLLYLSKLCEEHGRKYIIRVTDAKYAATYVHRAAFLWLGEGKASGSEEGNQEPIGEAGKAEIDPEQYATLDIDGDTTTTRPVYNLPKLLGPANVARLRSESSMLKEGRLFLLRSQRSGIVNKKLWSLQGFMATFTNL
ncbi:putative esterase-like protein [Diaporthe ampelina]|uniref:Putative esterase-like protein n=1 Tax=Diaporthe ampelina TaxID=1214573 RepID=A0A0G2FS20_9PEZI|nr:putative esterase-like protein [Diaporthe ampelina]